MNIRVGAPQGFDRAGDRLARVIPDVTAIEQTALANIPSVNRFVARNTLIAREAQPLDKLRLFISGWAMRSVGIADDRRQIVGFVLPGDLEGFYADFRQASATDVVTLTRCEIAEFSMSDVLRLAHDFPGIGAGFRKYMLAEGTILGNQVLRLGRMTAYERVSHLLLEIFERQVSAAPDGTIVDFPLTQSVVADALGLSVVHVNRQVMRLRQEGLVELDRKSLKILDFNRLQAICNYKIKLMPKAPAFAGAEERLRRFS